MGVILGILGVVGLGLVVRWFGVEIGVQHLPLCRRLVRFAAARLPVDERAAAESEWLAVIEDLRSPAAQLVHSLSFAISAFRIRQAIKPRTARTLFFKIYVSTLTTVAGLSAVGTFAFIYLYRDVARDLAKYFPTSKLALAGFLAIDVLLLIVASYLLFRLLRRIVGRYEQRRGNLPTE
ncbi:hypothetical protein ACFQX9_10955 [Bradyrhizobium sp. GCM10028915]|uniref:hypothetical protein n=1 Tax=Bradyrhizobium sp. GCM10028915 TaxID=3273385 RepID=UPI003621CE73